jgi:hypothetical protein
MKNNLVPKKIIADINKKLKATSEKQMSEIIRKVYPDVKIFSVTYNTTTHDFFIVGLTPEQELHLKSLVK